MKQLIYDEIGDAYLQQILGQIIEGNDPVIIREFLEIVKTREWIQKWLEEYQLMTKIDNCFLTFLTIFNCLVTVPTCKQLFHPVLEEESKVATLIVTIFAKFDQSEFNNNQVYLQNIA